MQNTTKFLINLFDYLNQNVNYAVLRNFEGLPSDNDSRDIDIIIEKKELNRHKSSIQSLIIDSGWQIITYLNNGRLITYVCGIIDDGNVELVQLDFFLHTSVHGITLADAKEIVENRAFNGKVYYVSKDYEFLDKYLYNRAVGASYPEKYNNVREYVAHSDIVKKKLNAIFGCDDLNLIDKLDGKKLLFRALKYNMQTQFFRTMKRMAESLFIYYYNFFRSTTAPRLGFTGPDGSGKTTVIELLHKNISPVFGKATEFYHFRPTLFPNMGEAGYSAGIKKKVDREYNKPHRGSKKGTLNSFVRLCYYTIDYILGFWIKVKSHCRITKFIIFDRYYTDIIVDSRRTSIYLNTKFLYYWGKLMVPSLHYNILLTADTDVILSRKQELNRKGIDSINNKLHYLSTKKGYYLIKNNGTAEEAVQQILTIVFEEQHRKNMSLMR
jgi:thymidylate kinase